MDNCLSETGPNRLFLHHNEYMKYSYEETVIIFNRMLYICNELQNQIEKLDKKNVNVIQRYKELKNYFSSFLHVTYLELQLKKDKKEIRYNVSDGNCLFDAFARSLNDLINNDRDFFDKLKINLKIFFNSSFIDSILIIDNPKNFDQYNVRNLLSMYYETVKQEYFPFMEKDKKGNIIEPNIKKNKVWGGNLEIVLMAKLFLVNIILVNSEGKHNHQTTKPDSFTDKNIILAYRSPNHYNCVRDIGTPISLCYNYPMNLNFDFILNEMNQYCENYNINLDDTFDDKELDYNTFNLRRINYVNKKSNQKKKTKQNKKNNAKKTKKVFRISNLDKNTLQKAFKDHIDMRFLELGFYLNSNKSAKVIIGGSKNKSNLAGRGGNAERQFRNKEDYEAVKSYLDNKTEELRIRFPKRVSFGNVSYENSSINRINVWGANELNWNLPYGSKIEGTNMAKDMKIQKEGVFGIVTTPSKGLPSIKTSKNPLDKYLFSKNISNINNKDLLYTLKIDVRDEIIKRISTKPELASKYSDILDFVNLDLFLFKSELTICESIPKNDSLHYAFMVSVNKHIKKNIDYKNKLPFYDGKDFTIENIKSLCYYNMMINHIKLENDLKDHIDLSKINIKKYGMKLLKKDVRGGLLSIVSLCDRFKIDIAIIYDGNLVKSYNYGSNDKITISEIESCDNYPIVLCADMYYYPTKSIYEDDLDLKKLLDYEKMKKDLNM